MIYKSTYRVVHVRLQQVNIKIPAQYIVFLLFLNIAMIKSLKMSTFVFGAR